MKTTVFYAWQSDLPNPLNRGFIRAALDRAIQRISADDSISIDPRLDHDTQGVPGAPDIARTILLKIETAGAFVGDVSLVGKNHFRRRDAQFERPGRAWLRPESSAMIAFFSS